MNATERDTGLIGGLHQFSSITFQGQKCLLKGENIDGLSIINLLNVMKFSDKELIKILKEQHGLDIETTDGIEKFKKLYDEAFKIYTEDLLIDLKTPFKGHRFDNKDEILEFIKHTYNAENPDRRQIYCDLLKLMFALNEIDKYPTISSAEQDIKEFMQDHILKDSRFEVDFSKLMEKKEGESYYEAENCVYKLQLPNGGERKLNFTLRYRGKTRAKTALKLLFNEEGKIDIREATKDNLGYEFEADNTEDSIYFLELDYYIRKRAGNFLDETDYRQKPGFYTEEQIQSFKEDENLTQEFRDYIFTIFTSLRRSTGVCKYQDAKGQGPVKNRKGQKTGSEGRTVIKGNKNQSGLSNSKVIDGRKKILAFIGMRGWVSQNYIRRVIDDLKGNYGIEKSADRIFDFLTDGLLKVDVKGLGKVIFSTEGTLQRLVDLGENTPMFIANSIAKHTGKSIEEILNQGLT